MIFLGRDVGGQRDYLERVGQVLHEEIHRFLEEALVLATCIVSEHRGLLDRPTRELIGQETLDTQGTRRHFSAGMSLRPGEQT